MPKQRVQKKIEDNAQKENEQGRRSRKRKANSPLSDGLSRKRAVLGEHNPQPLREHNRQTEQLREHNPQPLRENNRQTEQHNERLLKTHSHQKPQHQDRPFTSNSHQTEQLFEDMGVKYISQVGLDTVTGIPKETTPAVWSTDGCQPDVACSQLPEPPGAPKIWLSCPTVTLVPSRSTEGTLDSTPTQKKYLSLDTAVRSEEKLRETRGFDYFSMLSDEMILAVYHWLPRFVLAKCARVCKRWSRLVKDDSLWKRIDLANKTLSSGVLGCVLSRGVWALRLAKSEIEGPVFLPQSFTRTELRISRLQYLDLSMAGVPVDVLESLFGLCTDLRKISLENLEVSEKVCKCIGKNRDLEVLNMAMCQGVTLDGLMMMLTSCEKLESLNMGWTSLCKQSVVVLCVCLPQSVTRLNLSGCRDNLSDEDVLHLCEACPNLRELDLSDSTSLTCQSVMVIANRLKQLEYLALSRCYHILGITILQLRCLPRLAAIDVFGMLREGALNELKDSMPNIDINNFPFSSIARPTTGIRRTSIWGIRVRENFV